MTTQDALNFFIPMLAANLAAMGFKGLGIVPDDGPARQASLASLMSLAAILVRVGWGFYTKDFGGLTIDELYQAIAQALAATGAAAGSYSLALGHRDPDKTKEAQRDAIRLSVLRSYPNAPKEVLDAIDRSA